MNGGTVMEVRVGMTRSFMLLAAVAIVTSLLFVGVFPATSGDVVRNLASPGFMVVLVVLVVVAYARFVLGHQGAFLVDVIRKALEVEDEAVQ